MSKRRRHRRRHGCGCGGCVIALVVVMVLVIGGLYAGSVFAWNTYVSPQVGGATLNEVFAMIGQIYKADESKIVTNPYDEEDEDSFYTDLRDALFLAPSVDIKDTFSAVLADLMAGNTVESSDDEPEEMAMAEESPTGNTALDRFLEILDFDFSRLEDYKDEYETPQVLEVSDKQIAAFINGAIGQVLNTESIQQSTAQLTQMGIKLDQVASIPQVVISGANPLTPETTALTLTIKVDLRNTAEAAIESMMPQLKFVAKILPKALYATATVYPNDENAVAEIKFNNFEEGHMSTVYKLFDGIMAFTNKEESEPLTINSLLKDVNQKAIDALASVQSMVPISFVNTGSLEIKPIETLMSMMNITNITQTQFLCMIRDICLPTFDSVKEELGFSATTTRDQIEAALDDSVSFFVSEIESKYAITHGFIDPDNAFDTLTNVSQDTTSFAENISITNLDFSNSVYVSYDHKVAVPYKALAKLVNDKMGDSLGESIKVSVINMVYDSVKNEMGVIAEIDLMSAFGTMEEGSIQARLIPQLLPQCIYLKANINLDSSDTSLQINGLTLEETQAHLDTITSLASSLGMSLDSFDYTTMTTQLGSQLTSALDQISTQLGTDIIFEDEYALLPNIYEVMSATVLHKEGEADLTPTQVYGVFRDLHEIPDEYKISNKADSISSFVEEVNTKYYIANEHKLTDDSETPMVTKLTDLGSNYDSIIMGADLAAAWKSASAGLTTVEEKNEVILSNFSPVALEGELANIFAGSLNITADSIKNAALDSVYIISDTEIEIILKADFSASAEDTMDYSNLIPAFIIKATLDISKINTEEKCITITLNNMAPDGTLVDFSTLCSRLSSSAFNISTIEEQCDGTVKTQLANLFSKISLTLTPAAIDEPAKAYIGSIYDAAFNAIKTDSTTFTKSDLADTISALHEEFEVVGQSNIDEEADKYTGTPSVTVEGGTHLRAAATLTARNIGASMLKAGFTSIATNLSIPEEEIELFQVALLDYTDKSTVQDYMDSFDSYLTDSLAVSNLATLTLKVGAQNLGYTSSLLPANLYLNIFIDVDTCDVKILYNNLTETEMSVLTTLAGGNATALDASQSEAELKSYIRGLELFKVTYMVYNMSVKFGDVIDAHAGSINHTEVDSKVCGEYVVDFKKPITELV